MKTDAKEIVLPYDPSILERAQRMSEWLALTPEQRAAKAAWLARWDKAEATLGMKAPPAADEPDSKPDNGKKSLPDSADVRDLCRLLQKGLPTGHTQIEIAREFTGKDNGKAESLLRQARRFRHLWQ